MPSNDLNAHYKRMLLEAWVRAIMSHAFEYFPTEVVRDEFILMWLDVVARDFNAVLTWHGGEVVVIDEIR